MKPLAFVVERWGQFGCLAFAVLFAVLAARDPANAAGYHRLSRGFGITFISLLFFDRWTRRGD